MRNWVLALVFVLNACSVSPDSVLNNEQRPSELEVDSDEGSRPLETDTLAIMLPVHFDELSVRYEALLGPLRRFEYERQADCLDEGGFAQAAQVYRALGEMRVGEVGWHAGEAYGGAIMYPNLDAGENDSGIPPLYPQQPMIADILEHCPEYGIDPSQGDAVIEVLVGCPVWTEEDVGTRDEVSELRHEIDAYLAAWTKLVSEIDERADVKAVIDGIVPCLHESSPLFAEVTEPGLFLVDDRERPDEEVALMVRMAMECYRPLEEIRRPLREALRDEYVDEHYAELLEWQERIVSVREAVEALN